MDFRKLENVKYYMKAMGWIENRKVDISIPMSYLEGLGYEVFQSAKDFLYEFYGLKFYFLTPSLAEIAFNCKDEFGYEPDVIDFIIEESHMRTEKHIVDNYSNYLGVKTLPVGQCEESESLFLIDENSEFYAVNGNQLIRLGNNIYKFFDNFIIERKFKIEKVY